MAKIFDMKTYKMPTFPSKYPLLDLRKLPLDYFLIPISHKEGQIKEFDVLLFHRLLKLYYGMPCEIESEVPHEYRHFLEKKVVSRRVKGKTYQRKIETIPTTDDKIQRERIELLKKASKSLENKLLTNNEWRYFLTTKSGGTIYVGTTDSYQKILIGHVFSNQHEQPTKKMIKEGERFVNDLLSEANRLKHELFNIKKEFKDKTTLQVYTVHNTYRSNYISAELMLESAEDNEYELVEKALTHDFRDGSGDPELEEYTMRGMFGVGMYYAASFTYFFMALEGFVNLIYHAFLNPELRDRQFNLEARLDLEQKLRMMPLLCAGFKGDILDPQSRTFQNFKKLKKYRNLIFHSRIEDSLKEMTIFEGGFFYSRKIDKVEKYLLPTQRLNLKKKNIDEVKRIVDALIGDIMTRMNRETKALTKKHILTDFAVPFSIVNDEVILGIKLRS